MAEPTTSIAFGHSNAGFQIGQNYGPVSTAIHLPPIQRVQTPPTPCSTVPFRRDPDFIARSLLTHDIRSKLSAPAARVALVGLGGVGKSQLAIEYSYLVRQQSADTWVIWLHASNVARFEQSVQDAADNLRISGREDPQADIFKLFHDWLCDVRNGMWLVMLDNADDASFLRKPPSPSDRQPNGAQASRCRSLYEYIPNCDHGSVLITTRSRGAALQLVDSNEIVEVQPMGSEQALALVDMKLGKNVDSRDAKELAETLEFMPLAITQAAAFIRERSPRCSIQQYLEKVRNSNKSKGSLLDQDRGDLRRDGEAKNSIILTWQISFEWIYRERRSAADLLSLMSFFDRQGIPEIVLRSPGVSKHMERGGKTNSSQSHENNHNDDDISSESEDSASEADADEDFEKDVEMLRSFSFISINANSTTFEMHRLVQQATQRWLKANGQLEQWKAQCVHNLDMAFPIGEYKNWLVCQMLFPHAKSIAGERPKDNETLLEWASLMYKAAWYACRKGAASNVESLAALSLKVRETVLGQDNEGTLLSMEMLAIGRYLAGLWAQAEELLIQVVETKKRLFGEENPDTLRSIANLALIYGYRGRWSNAEVLEVEGVETSRKVLGEEHPDTLKSMSNLASTYASQGRWNEAEELLLQVVEKSKRVLGEEHPNTLTSIANLASTYMNQGRWDKSEMLEVEVLETSKRVLGEEHPDTLISMANLATTYWSQERWSEAEKLLLHVLESSKRVLGEEHPNTLTTMANLALTYMNQERFSEAETLEVKVLETRKRVLGEEHPDTLMSMANLALVYWDQGRCGEVEVLEVEVLETRKRVLGEEHPDTLISMSNLAHTHKAQGQDQLAIELMSTCASISSRKLGCDHPSSRARSQLVEEWREETASMD